MDREEIARACHEINRAYCASLGDDSHLSWEDAPEWQKASVRAGVDMHLENPDATPEASHEAWLAQKVAEGWVYGETKNAEKKEHPCCLPFDELPQEQKSKDYIFRGVVHALKSIVLATPSATVSEGSERRPRVTRLPTSEVEVMYVGRRPEWHDRLYKSGLKFTSGQVRVLPYTLAKKLLRHGDLFVEVEAFVAEEDILNDFPVAIADIVADVSDEHSPDNTELPEADKPADDTQALLDEAAAKQDAERQEESRVEDIIDRVNLMDKEGLAEFVQTQYQQKLDKRISLDTLRQETLRLINQFGVA